MKSFIDFSENLDDKRKQLMQKQRVMQQMEKERASRSNQEFQQDKEEKQSKIDQEKEEKKRLEQLKKEIKDEIKQEMGADEVDEEFGKMTKKQTQAYTGMDDKEQKALYKKMKKDGNFDVKKNLAGAASDDKDLGEELNKNDKPFIKKLIGKTYKNEDHPLPNFKYFYNRPWRFCKGCADNYKNYKLNKEDNSHWLQYLSDNERKFLSDVIDKKKTE